MTDPAEATPQAAPQAAPQVPPEVTEITEVTEVTEPVTEVTDLVEVTEPVTEVTDPVAVTQLSAIEFIRQAQEPGLAFEIDTLTKGIKEQTGASYRQILRGYALVLRAIGVSMPWDTEAGLDARRFHPRSQVSLPPLRECIGACLGLEFSRPDSDSSSSSSDQEASTTPDGDEVSNDDAQA